MTELNAWAEAWQTASPAPAQPRSRKPAWIQNLLIEPGRISARVHEGKSVRPAHTQLAVPYPSMSEWRTRLLHRGLPPYVLGLLLAEECPEILIHAFDRAQIHVIVDPHMVTVTCTCSSRGWCKHAYALWSRFGQEIARQPLILLRLLGLDDVSLRQILEQWLAPFALEPTIESPSPLATDASLFWESTTPLPEQPTADASHPANHLLRTMGIPPLWPTDRDLDSYLEATYVQVRNLVEARQLSWGSPVQARDD